MKIRIDLEGTSPMLQHNIQLADPLNPIARQMKLISKKRTKTDDDFEELARLEFLGGLYINADLGPYVKGVAIEKSFVEGGRISKQGKSIERGLFITDVEVPLLYKGPRTAEELWEDVNFRDVQAVRVGQSRVMRTRPIFRNWSLSADAELLTDVLNLDTFESLATDAGLMVGLGDNRPRNGRFSVQVTKL